VGNLATNTRRAIEATRRAQEQPAIDEGLDPTSKDLPSIRESQVDLLHQIGYQTLH